MIPKFRFYLVYALLAAAALFVHTHQDAPVPVSRPLNDIPRHLDEWAMAGETRFNERVLEVLQPTDYLYRVYRDPEGRRVSFYLGYHDGGPAAGPVHSPKHCLPGSGWHQVSERKLALPAEGEQISLVRSVYQNGESRELFLYWFQVKGKTLASEYALKIAEITNSIFHNRRDAAFIRISIPFESDEERAFETGIEFVKDFYPEIKTVLPI